MSKRLLRLHQIIGPDGKLPVSRTWFYDQISKGIIPEPQKCGHLSLWDEAAIDAVLDRILAGKLGSSFAESSAEMTGRARKRAERQLSCAAA